VDSRNSTLMLNIADKDTIELRFQIGDRVECNCGEWKLGTVVKLFYEQKSFEPGKCAPYQVRLDERDRLIFAPQDTEKVIRAADPISLPVVEADFEEDFEEVGDDEKLPVTIITGFLGAGKTTLVNYILNADHGKKICVIENEFGAVSIDEALVKENLKVAEEVISLDNGCACCTVRGDLMKALTQLKDRKKDFDMILVETTGLANPAPVTATFTQNPVVANHFRVDGIVCLVDCKFILEHINETRDDDQINEAVTQVAFSDRILMNKIDLVSKEELAELKTTIHSINSFAELIETERSNVDLGKIMNLSAFSVERLQGALDEFDIEDLNESMEEGGHSHGHDEHVSEHGHAETEHAETEHGHAETEHAETEHAETEHGHDESEHDHGEMDCDDDLHKPKAAPVHEHDHVTAEKRKKKHDLSGVGSLGLTSDKPLTSAAFNNFMSDLLRFKARELYRSKGVLCFAEEGDAKFIFQGVHEQIQYTTAKEPWGEGERVSKVVLIGRNLDHTKLKAEWEKCKAVS